MVCRFPSMLTGFSAQRCKNRGFAARACLYGVAIAGFVLAMNIAATQAWADAAGRAAHFGAVQASEADFRDVETASLDEMSDMRGGFSVGGLELAIGANIRTFIDGALVLESMAQVTASGMVSEVVSTATAPPGGGVTFNFGGDANTSLQDIAPANINLGALSDDKGVAINDSNGFSAALHRITQNQILGVIVNAADGRNLRQELDIEITVANFGGFQQSIRSAIMNGRLVNGIGGTN